MAHSYLTTSEGQILARIHLRRSNTGVLLYGPLGAKGLPEFVEQGIVSTGAKWNNAFKRQSSVCPIPEAVRVRVAPFPDVPELYLYGYQIKPAAPQGEYPIKGEFHEDDILKALDAPAASADPYAGFVMPVKQQSPQPTPKPETE